MIRTPGHSPMTLRHDIALADALTSILSQLAEAVNPAPYGRCCTVCGGLRALQGPCDVCQAIRAVAHEARNQNTARPLADLIEDVEWLLGTDAPESIAARVGYNRPRTLARRLFRNGRPDLARHFEPKAAA